MPLEQCGPPIRASKLVAPLLPGGHRLSLGHGRLGCRGRVAGGRRLQRARILFMSSKMLYPLKEAIYMRNYVTCRVFSSGGGGKEGNLPPPTLTAVFPPFRLAVIIVYYIFKMIIHPQDPYTTSSHAKYSPPSNYPWKMPCIDLSKTLQKAKAMSKRSRMTLVSAS